MKKLLCFLMISVIVAAFFSVTTYGTADVENESITAEFSEGSSTSVSFNWNQQENAEFYYVYKYNPDTKTYEFHSAVRDCSTVAENIESGRTYRFRVLPVEIKNGRRVPLKASETVVCVTAPAEKPVLRTADIGKKYITLQWDKVKGATEYTLFILDSEKGEYTEYKSTKECKITVNKLKKDTQYSFILQSCRKVGEAVAFGEKSEVYSEYTHTDGLPHTPAQLSKAYNVLVNGVKAQQNMTVKYTKEIDTEVLFCSRQNLTLTVKNTANLYKGVLNKEYIFRNGISENKTPYKLFEPYSKKADVVRDDIESYTVEETKNGYKASFTIKKDDGNNTSGSYYNGALSLKNPKQLKTTPLKIISADTYYDTATISFTVKKGKLRNLEVQGAVLADIDFEVSTVSADTTVVYSLYEKYAVTY